MQKGSQFYYIPLYDTLRALLSNGAVISELKSSANRTLQYNDVLCDFCDAQQYSDHPLFSKESTALQIVAYYDELEVCNPIGAASKVHKIGVVFMFLANFSPQFRSSLRPTQLVAIARSEDIKQFGINAVLEPFVRDLTTLTNDGINISVDGIDYHYKGALLAFLADNLASHSIGGFKESMSFAFRFCRSCMTTHAKSQRHFVASKFQLRSPQEHARQCVQLDGPLRNHYSKIYGINRRSILDDVPYFSVATGLPHDIMHDLLEGAVTYEIKALLGYAIGRKYFTLDDLNHRIDTFDYGYSELSNRPFNIEIGTSHCIKLRQTASSSWLLSRMLSLLIGDKIPKDDDAWKCYQLLMKIVDICTARFCSKESVAYLSTLIEEHHFTFVSTYSISLIPKQHFMVHYPQQIIRFGPLIHCWNMRHEAKLNLCKKVSKFGNFKNICYSAAMRHQRWMCLQLQSQHFLELPPECGGKTQTHTLSEESLDFQRSYKLQFPTAIDSTSIQHLSWVKYHHHVYKKGGVVATRIGETPIFGKILDVISINSKIFIFLQMCKVNHFDDHYHGFSVTITQLYDLVSLVTLPLPHVLHLYRNFEPDNRELFIVQKYGILY